jgi:SAM-dependent methyltransferase
MICNNCFSEHWEEVFIYFGPDKYEKYCGLDYVWRRWNKCVECGHYQSESDYDLEKLMPVYGGYRSEPFRGVPIREQFSSVMALPNHLRENHSRVNWLNLNLDRYANMTVLDVGSGFGVFPHELRSIGFKVTCTEINDESLEFLSKELGFKCVNGDPDVDHFGKYGIVTMVHVLEHMQSPSLFLNAYRKYLSHNGHIFIEVPDSLEFGYLPKDHDEFNSCHLNFFSVPSLTSIVERSGFTVKMVERFYHSARNLSRIRLIGRKS